MESNTRLSASEIAAKLPDEWVQAEHGIAYTNSQTRVDVRVTTNGSLHGIGFIDNEDLYAESVEFANDLLSVIGGRLTPLLEMDLVRKLGQNLVEWQRERSPFVTDDDPVEDLLLELLALHRRSSATANPEAASLAKIHA